mmetsp:Transcript_7445/g.14948  ORF Transcript_7445/g.14948 Transcript_7445/m.14948 type:complete len:141 (+) Transcript_7445:162-584(+)
MALLYTLYPCIALKPMTRGSWCQEELCHCSLETFFCHPSLDFTCVDDASLTVTYHACMYKTFTNVLLESPRRFLSGDGPVKGPYIHGQEGGPAQQVVTLMISVFHEAAIFEMILLFLICEKCTIYPCIIVLVSARMRKHY